MKKYVLPLVLAVIASAVLGGGAYCAVTFASCFVDDSPWNHPVAAPGSILVGIVCALGLVGLLYGYARLRRRYPSRWMTVVDVLTVLLLAAPFFALWLKLGALLGA